MSFLIQLFLKSFIETINLVGVIIIAGLILGILRNSALKNFQMSFGSNAVMLTGFIGVPVHELSHAIFALIFGHKIMDIKLLQRPDANGVMGYVNHSYNKNNIYQQIGNFFIGTAPIFGGAIFIIILMKYMMPAAYGDLLYILKTSLHVTVINRHAVELMLASYFGLLKVIFSPENFRNIYFYIFLFISICVSSHISLSSADIKQSYNGVAVIFIVFLMLNIFGISKYVPEFSIIKYNLLITGIMILTIFLSLFTFIISIISRLIKS